MMMSNRAFVYPGKTLNQHRNKFDLSHQHKTSFYHGKLVPLDLIEVIPGDTFKIDLASMIRMSTPIAPIMDNIVMHVAAYWIPARLCYEHFEEVMGANKSGAWTTTDNTYTIPDFSDTAFTGTLGPSSLGQYLGLSNKYSMGVSCLPARAYCIVWNEYYRNQAVSAPLPVDLSAANEVLVDEIDDYDDEGFIEQGCLRLGKYADYFTKCLPEPQKHDDVLIPMNDLPITTTFTNDTASMSYLNPVAPYNDTDSSIAAGKPLPVGSITTAGPSLVSGRPAYADNVDNTINALRFAFQLQKFYEKDARYGSRYFEMLSGHFGVSNPDLVLNRPEFLGEMNWRINIDQVLSTAGYSNTDTTTVGAPGANSATAHKGGLFTKSFTEFGYILIVGGTRQEHTYSQGWNRLWDRKDRLDFYDPLFANIGEQPVYKHELVYVPGDGTQAIFGYQEAWAELRFIPDRVSGLLNPSQTGSLDYWTLADKYNSAPSLNESFIYEDRTNIARALVTGNSGPDFIADFYFKTTAVRPLPLFSIPGLADHH